MREMGRKYLCTTLMMFFQKLLISDDLLAVRLANNQRQHQAPDHVEDVEQRLAQLERLVSGLQRDSDAVLTITNNQRAANSATREGQEEAEDPNELARSVNQING